MQKDVIKANIDWLEKYKFIEYVPIERMNDKEKRYHQSDNCPILRNIKNFDENEFNKIKKKEYQEINKLSDIEKFKCFFSKMEEEFDRKEIFNEKEYILTYDYNSNIVTIKFNDSSEYMMVLDFNKITNLSFQESLNSIFCKLNNVNYEFYLENISAKCCLRFCCN